MAAAEIAPGDRMTGTTPAAAAVAELESARRPRKRRSADRDGATTSSADEEIPGGSKQTTYECRFCFMRFQKSQALGGHMNRHRQEREKEQYQHAQQLVSSMAQQQMPRNWTSLAAVASELTQSGSGPGAALSRLSSQVTVGAATRPQPFPPQISFTSYRAPAPTSGSNPSVPSSPSSNYYLPSNSSSTNLHNMQWSVEGFSNAAAVVPPPLPRSAPFNAVDTTSSSLQAPGVVASHHEFLAGLSRATAAATNNNSDSCLVSSSTPTSTTQQQLPYDMYNSYFGGM